MTLENKYNKKYILNNKNPKLLSQQQVFPSTVHSNRVGTVGLVSVGLG